MAIAEIFSEVIIAPDFSMEALEILKKKKNLRLMKSLLAAAKTQSRWDIRSVGADSFLMQERDLRVAQTDDLKIVTKRQPTESELAAMLFGWRIVKHVKSNAIV